MLRKRLEQVRTRIQKACQRCGRDPSTITCVGVTKTIPVETIREAISLGLTDIGENRVQDALAKRDQLGAAGQSVRWHLIGHLQSNKARHAVELFDVIHSVDSLELIEELERHAAKRAQGSRLEAEGKSPKPIGTLIQVNVSGEATKFGCTPDHVVALGRAISSCAQIRLDGLMTIAPLTQEPEEARPCFRRLRELRDELAVTLNLEPQALSLSMGMSHDFDVAIEEGADMIRVGTAIFGTRT